METLKTYQLEKELKMYKELVEDLKKLELETSTLEYDYDDECYLDYHAFDMEEYIDNWIKVYKIDEEEKINVDKN